MEPQLSAPTPPHPSPRAATWQKQRKVLVPFHSYILSFPTIHYGGELSLLLHCSDLEWQVTVRHEDGLHATELGLFNFFHHPGMKSGLRGLEGLYLYGIGSITKITHETTLNQCVKYNEYFEHK